MDRALRVVLGTGMECLEHVPGWTDIGFTLVMLGFISVGVKTIFQKVDSWEKRQKVKMVITRVITINRDYNLQPEL